MKLINPFRVLVSLMAILGVLLSVVMAALGAARVAMKSGVASTSLASSPRDLTSKSWKRALLGTKDAITNKNLSMLASGIAYGGILAFFPLVVACVAIASFVITPAQLNEVALGIEGFLPSDMASLLNAQLQNATGNESANIIIATIAIGLALFGVSGAMTNLINGLNVAYDVKETRGLVKVRLVSIGLTCMLVAGLMIVLPLIALGGDILRMLSVSEPFVWAFGIVRWVILALVMMAGLAVVYRYAPARHSSVRWQWVSWGASVATALWLLVTAVFFIYVQNFANFSDSYSLFAGIIVLMMWLNFTGLIVLIGAAVNQQLEAESRQLLT